ncbi:MAG TPA: competence/damage-inducible protein A [Segetibacter sp.]|jgi:nicotinamide-nucleotide amidase
MNENKVYASIITIGDELLIGQTIDTNSAWMAQELNKIGVWVRRRVAVGDVRDEIWNALDDELKLADIILITGGLGPTADDITKPVLCEYFDGKLVINEEALQNVINISNHFKRPLLEVNRKQAEVPDVCTVIQNRNGSAPGMLFEKQDKIIISMPGVPFEMKGMMTDYVIPQLPSLFSLPKVEHRTLLTAGIGESFLAERIKDFEQSLPQHIKLAYLPNLGMVRLRLTSTGNDESLKTEIDEHFNKLQQQLRDVMVVNEDITLEEAIGRMLIERGETVSLAESCTGGYISHLLTSIAGSSAYFMGGVVSYDNAVKQNVLGVDVDTLNNVGAVSEETVRQMANGAQKLMNTNYAIAVSGIMGPGGGTGTKPVGTVWMAVCNDKRTITKMINLRSDRRRNIESTAMNALNILRLLLLDRI